MTIEQEARSMGSETDMRLARAIDHTKLTFGPDEDDVQAIATLCQEARAFNFAAVCVRPQYVAQAKAALAGTDVRVATVIGFPPTKVFLAQERNNPTVGFFSIEHKVAETRQAVADGADELDLVINVAQFKRDLQEGSRAVQEELAAIRAASEGRMIKVIIETDLLNSHEIEKITRWCVDTGMDMVKTSTGMIDGGQGATLEAVAVIRQTLQNLKATLGIKASGGIKTREQALAFLEAGACRLGTSSGTRIAQGFLPPLDGDRY